MKLIFKYLSILLLLAIFLIGGATVVLYYFNSQDVVTEVEVREVLNANQILSNPLSGFAQLSTDEQAAYLRISNEIEQLNSNVSLSGNNVNEDQFKKISQAILKDHPEFFYIDTIEYLKTIDGKVESVTVNFIDSVDAIELQKQSVERWKNNILSQITSEMSNYDIALFLHDYLVKTTSYDENTPNNQSLLSIVKYASSVCAGYAKAYQYLLNEAGIFSTYVSGDSLVGPHAWNLLEIDGEYGWVDITWDDPNFSGNNVPIEYISHTYFGLSTEELNKTHFFSSEESYPNVLEPSFNYFNKEGLSFDLSNLGDSYRAEQAIISAQNNQDTIELKFTDFDQANNFLRQLSYNPLLYSSTINYINDKNYPVLTFLLN